MLFYSPQRLSPEKIHLPLLGCADLHYYFSPHPLLRAAVAHYTLTLPPDIPLAPSCLELVPDASGCIIFTGSPHGLHAAIWGPTSRIVTVPADGMHSPIQLFVELLPGGLFHLTGIPQNELVDRKLPLEAVLPSLWCKLKNPLEEAKGIGEAVQILDRELLNCLGKYSFPPVLNSALQGVRESGGLLSVEHMAREEHYSPRQLSRLFHQHLGVGAKTFARLVRVNAAVKLLQQDRSSTLTQLGAQVGYYDQAHFIRDFQSICEVSPGTYRQNLSVFYNEPFKF